MADRDEATRDLTQGVALDAFNGTGLVAGKIGEADALLVRGANGFHAIGAICTHKGAPLAKGLLTGDTIRCPWHHACFDARTGSAVAAPAFKALERWACEERDGRVYASPQPYLSTAKATPDDRRIVIVGAGAAGAAAADTLVALGLSASTTLVGAEADAPYDRTMLTKHFLAGAANESELPLEMDDLAARGVNVRLSSSVVAIDREARLVLLADGTTLPYTALILATGAEPKRLDIPGGDLPHVRLLRSVADARAIITALPTASTVVIAGGSFIGLEAAAALRDRKIAVTVVSADDQPFERTLGSALSHAIMAVHRRHGTEFRLGRRIARVEASHVELDDGATLPADLVIVGLGVSPRTSLAEQAGLEVDNGVLVDERLRTSDRDIYAVGDIARWPDPHSGEAIRVEHWAVAQRQGQTAAANAAGHNLRYDAVPFFWTLHFDFSVRVVGHGSGTLASSAEGDVAKGGGVVRFIKDDRTVAVATVERDLASLQAETDLERRLGHPAVTVPV